MVAARIVFGSAKGSDDIALAAATGSHDSRRVAAPFTPRLPFAFTHKRRSPLT
jgi:hypothetical protein